MLQFHLMDEPQIRKSLEIIYKYLAISDHPEKANVIFVAGGSTITPAIKAAELYKQGFGSKIFITAKRGTFSNPDWKEDDAVVYKKKMVELGVPEGDIVSDPISTNSLEEADDSVYLMKQEGIDPKTVIIVDRPIHQRREFATFVGLHEGMGIRFINCPADEPLEYNQATLDRAVAEIDRLEAFALQGTLAKQIFPKEVLKAYDFLQNEISTTFGSKQ